MFFKTKSLFFRKPVKEVKRIKFYEVIHLIHTIRGVVPVKRLFPAHIPETIFNQVGRPGNEPPLAAVE